MSTEQTDESLEDLEKFEKIDQLYRNLMFNIAFDILNNEYDAEKIVQIAFIKIARYIEYYKYCR